MAGASILCQWDGESFAPINNVWARRADDEYVVGARYFVEGKEERSMASHRQYFAALHDAWMNLSEEASERFASSEHLRKWALIKAGYRDERSVVCASKAEAQRVKAFIRPMDDEAVVLAHESVVTVYTAKSQSLRAMGKEDFQKSKAAVLDIVASMAGVTAEDIQREAGAAA